MKKEQMPIFGRQADIDYLRERIQQPGMTILSGRPQIGKTRLLEEIRDSIREKASPLNSPFLVGYCRSTGQESDSLL
ncbi:MAG: hypothetical protein ACKVH8_24060 [Pirellulales bacterium]|jgi:predicted ATPase